jgi:hypothetical protein
MRQIDAHAARGDVRIGEYLVEAIDRPARNACRFQRGEPVALRTRAHDGVDQRHERLAIAHARCVRREPRVAGPFTPPGDVAELAELPLMLAVVFVAARWIDRRFLADRNHASRFIVGVTAFALLLLAELILGVLLLGRTPEEALSSRDPVSGTGYYLSLCVFAVMPWFLGRRESGRGVSAALD